ncbi:MAG TPA: carboxypeptidase-like regulatory domain-containing protein, partial [Candidatus Eisenbacteria bacterium]|nr:carboxypeptidase-like regulatory domain-containing protein [Candidatus Eisenbacteria bacterium]
MISLRTLRSRYFLFFAAVLLFCDATRAQKDTGSIAGTVKDTSGALVAGAKVTVVDVDRGLAFTTTTSDVGEYVAGPLRVGNYTVTVEQTGFKKAVSVPVALDVQQRVVVNVTM